MLKNESAIDLLHVICNGCFELGKVPEQWTSGVVNPILKPGTNDKRLPTNYRGITITSVPSKIYCSVLNFRLCKQLEDNDILCEEQNGFRPKRSCEEHIYSLTSVITNRKISKQSTFVSFIDMRKAFDSVSRSLLWYKLRRAGIQGKFLSAIQSLYENVKCTVRVNDRYTPWFDVDCGVKQGCLLSPAMFAIYINDLAERINNLQCGIRIGDDLLSILLYADDIALIAPDEDSLQKMLDVVSDWCSQWKLDVNPSKSNVVHFRNPSIDRSNFNFTCSRQNIAYATSYKYLGMWLDEHLTFDKAVRELSKSASRALGALYGKFISAGGMAHSVYSKLYSTMVEPVLFYCSGIWGTKVHSVINSIQNKAAKFFMSVGRYTANTAIRGDMGWTSCFTKQRTACIRLLSRILRSDDTRLTRKITEWTKNRRKGWYVKVKRFAETVDATAILNDTLISTKTVMRTIKERFDVVDNDEFKQALFDDSNNVNGNKLRTYRLYKTNVKTERYLKLQLPKNVRRTVTLFRSGSLPLAIETGRYARPRTPVDERLCRLCNSNDVESEKQFLLFCSLYDDIRFEARTLIDIFDTLDMDSKFIKIMFNFFVICNL